MKKLIISIITLFTVVLQNYPAMAAEVTPVNQSDYIQAVIEANLMNNFPDGNFYEEMLITRGELAEILVKTFALDKRQINKTKKDIFIADVPVNYWAYQDIQTVLKTGVMKGYRDSMFFPNQRITKAEGLAIFAQAYGVFQFPSKTVYEILSSYPDANNIPQWARKGIATIIAEDFIKTDSQGNIKPLEPMTRADIAYVLSRYLLRRQQYPQMPLLSS
ncbi:S-layer homology domain-containing protein [Anabaena sp. FACHB-1237]|uniref:S-layer homology domain-containing protein n=1 Tax=Anabaena sp. FACHB-1237 TaxID=2692769 RepID=UPI001680C213|nr:S-layer homology domain-containing protein [Anabaena sp. FACHB-1237]MBD2138123.1 S-layer homology domain-containing protein [Anabaena sp. FACHB-1237]